ncbi:MAG TPA: hypothetical protein VGK99_15370 [Acidobacteriota bacterium]|jgi:hypothetical protein
MGLYDSEILLFQTCRGFDGRTHPVDIGKRNGRLALLFHPRLVALPSGIAASCAEDRARRRIRQAFFWGLTPTEKRTWQKALEGSSVRQIAREEGVSRSAIYERFRGNSKGQGGMIAKNPYVAVWWYFRSEKIL